jgi:peroxiredoxin
MLEPQSVAELPSTRPRIAAASALVALTIFTLWITWRAKTLESGSNPANRPFALLYKTAPSFTLPAINGGLVSLSDYRFKKKIVLSYWASWCGPCRLELPALKAFYEKAHKAGADFDFLAISLDEDQEAAESAAKQMKLPFPVLFDAHQKVAKLYGVFGIPALFIVDKNGRVSYGQTGFDMTLDFVLAQQLGVDPKTISPGGPNAASRH